MHRSRIRERMTMFVAVAALALIGAGPVAVASASGGGSGSGGGGGTSGGGTSGGGGGGGGKVALPLLISQTYTFDVNADGTTSVSDGSDRICRIDGFVYTSTGTPCVTDRFTTDLQGTKQLVFDGSTGQAWVDELNAWWTDPARRDTGGKLPSLSTECLSTLYVVDSAAPGGATLNPDCVIPGGA